jgi:Cu(I)/Ag(I) efflux system membrane fusion protein
VTGYVEHVFVDFVGQIVKKGDRLFTIYSPDLVATQEEYLLALRSRSVLKDSSFPWISSGSQSLLDATRQRLRLWDVQDAEIEQLEKDGKVKRELTIYSPVNGLVTEREAFHHGRFVSPEMDLYKLVDLSTVWILGEVYESELPYVRNGQAVEIELPYAAQATSLRGRVTYVYPYLEPKTRTVQVRMEFPNPGYRLRPGMFVNVKLKADLGRSIAVPEDAVLDTGTRQYVFVDRGEGYLEPRPVKAGAEAEGYIAIESGLRAGERVATAANFILDSESRLKGAFASMGTPEALQVESSGAKASGLRAEIVEPSVAKVGRNLLRVRITDASGRPVSGAGVELSLFMPQMANMAAMNVKATLEPMQDGQYQGQVDIPMAFSWQTIIAVRKDDKAMGTVHTTLLAR